MAYVALSRVTSVSGLHLQDLDENLRQSRSKPCAEEMMPLLQVRETASRPDTLPSQYRGFAISHQWHQESSWSVFSRCFVSQGLTSKAPLLQTTTCSDATDVCPTQTFLTWPAEVVVELLCEESLSGCEQTSRLQFDTFMQNLERLKV